MSSWTSLKDSTDLSFERSRENVPSPRICTATIALSADVAPKAEISREEAIRIATRFFAYEIEIEGSVGEPVAKGDNWVFPAKFGAAGVVHKDPILVNRRTGEASWAGLAALKAARGRKPGDAPK